ncbi:MAG: hypothetical protein J3Q66DRAFT_53870 [Benniella sp.]|nr:MAG: hypothetical protein J3Q66DRAFT_53870 [Benniella sp.]
MLVLDGSALLLVLTTIDRPSYPDPRATTADRPEQFFRLGTLFRSSILTAALDPVYCDGSRLLRPIPIARTGTPMQQNENYKSHRFTLTASHQTHVKSKTVVHLSVIEILILVTTLAFVS